MIVQVNCQGNNVTVTLKNGVTVDLSFNEDYVHLHFSGTKDNVVATPFRFVPNCAKVESANYIDVCFTAKG